MVDWPGAQRPTPTTALVTLAYRAKARAISGCLRIARAVAALGTTRGTWKKYAGPPDTRAAWRTRSTELSSISGRASEPVSCTTGTGASRVSAAVIALTDRAQARPSTSSGVTI